MFTGLIQAVGTISRLAPRGPGARLTLRGSFADGSPGLGESIAVDGACLTVARVTSGGFEADLSSETLRRTTARSWRSGRRVNLERALRPFDRLGGHFVQGHVDGRGKIRSLLFAEGEATLRVAYPAELAALIAEKGSIAVDGVSLTVAKLGSGWFEAALVPQTLAGTNLADRKAGDAVNLEADLIARYLCRLVPPRRTAARGGRRGPRA